MQQSSSELVERPQDEVIVKGKEKPRIPTAQVLPSDRFSFKVHLDLFKRFATLSRGGTQPVEGTAVEGEGVPVQAAELNVRFFSSIGLLTKTERGFYLPSSDLVRFVSARSVSDDRASPILRSMIETSWFAGVARSVLSNTKPMKDEGLLGELAIAAQTDRAKKGAALKVLIEYLTYSGIIVAKDEGFLIVENTSIPASEKLETTLSSQGLTHRLSQPDVGWHTIQTEDFSLKIRSDLAAVNDLLEYVQTLRRKIERLKTSSPPNYSPGSNTES